MLRSDKPTPPSKAMFESKARNNDRHRVSRDDPNYLLYAPHTPDVRGLSRIFNTVNREFYTAVASWTSIVPRSAAIPRGARARRA